MMIVVMRTMNVPLMIRKTILFLTIAGHASQATRTIPITSTSHRFSRIMGLYPVRSAENKRRGLFPDILVVNRFPGMVFELRISWKFRFGKFWLRHLKRVFPVWSARQIYFWYMQEQSTRSRRKRRKRAYPNILTESSESSGISISQRMQWIKGSLFFHPGLTSYNYAICRKLSSVRRFVKVKK